MTPLQRCAVLTALSFAVLAAGDAPGAVAKPGPMEPAGIQSVAAPLQPHGIPLDATQSRMARRACKFGQRYSSYYRRCVLWTPFDLI
jgi:hypothetical protein